MKMFEEQDLKLYHLDSSGSEEFVLMNLPTKESLINGTAYLLVNEASKKLYIWLGDECPARGKFMASRQAQAIRREKGLTFRIQTIDQGYETEDFKKSLSLLLPNQRFTSDSDSTMLENFSYNIMEKSEDRPVIDSKPSDMIKPRITAPTRKKRKTETFEIKERKISFEEIVLGIVINAFETVKTKKKKDTFYTSVEKNLTRVMTLSGLSYKEEECKTYLKSGVQWLVSQGFIQDEELFLVKSESWSKEKIVSLIRK